MNIVNICPACGESIATTPLVDILVTYQEDLTEQEIYEQGWHKKCYPPHLSFKAETLTRRIDGDMTFYKVKGGQFNQYGVTIWPETLQAAGFDLNTLAMVTSLTGYTAYYVLQGKTAKVVGLARG